MADRVMYLEERRLARKRYAKQYRNEIVKTVPCECGCRESVQIKRARLFPFLLKTQGTKFYRNGHNGRGLKRPTSVGEKIRKTRLGRNNGIVGNGHGMWQGGRYRLTAGYIACWVAPHTYVLEHRLVMSKHLGRPLLPSEVVHHINHKKDDNRLENLILLTDTAHRSFHMKERYRHSHDR